MSNLIIGGIIAGVVSTVGIGLGVGIPYHMKSEEWRTQFNEAARRVNNLVSEAKYRMGEIKDLIDSVNKECEDTLRKGFIQSYTCNVVRYSGLNKVDLNSYKRDLDKNKYYWVSGEPNYMTKDVYCKDKYYTECY